jgi:hypothetical protein
LADHRAIEDIERGEQGGRAMPDIIVGQRISGILCKKEP